MRGKNRTEVMNENPPGLHNWTIFLNHTKGENVFAFAALCRLIQPEAGELLLWLLVCQWVFLDNTTDNYTKGLCLKLE